MRNQLAECISTRSVSRRAFSLVEVLTVLGIIVIILGILLPVLSNARNAAKKAATLSVMSDLANAVHQFQIDQRRLPGYFKQRDMGSIDNRDTFGFTNMENLILDLSGGLVNSNTDDIANQIILVGPTNAARVAVSIKQIGSPTQSATGTVNQGYYKPDAKFFQAQTQAEGSRLGMPLSWTGTPGYLSNPVVVDSFGQPILAWVQDEFAPPSTPAFALENSGPAGASNPKLAKFYWASNAGFLRSKALGKRGEDQNMDSILSRTQNALLRAQTLEALCGNPAFPNPKADATLGRVLPAAPRAPILFHSAGPSGEYLGRDTRGSKIAANTAGLSISDTDLYVTYRPGGTDRDLITDGSFDDVIFPAGN